MKKVLIRSSVVINSRKINPASVENWGGLEGVYKESHAVRTEDKAALNLLRYGNTNFKGLIKQISVGRRIKDMIKKHHYLQNPRLKRDTVKGADAFIWPVVFKGNELLEEHTFYMGAKIIWQIAAIDEEIDYAPDRLRTEVYYTYIKDGDEQHKYEGGTYIKDANEAAQGQGNFELKKELYELNLPEYAFIILSASVGIRKDYQDMSSKPFVRVYNHSGEDDILEKQVFYHTLPAIEISDINDLTEFLLIAKVADNPNKFGNHEKIPTAFLRALQKSSLSYSMNEE